MSRVRGGVPRVRGVVARVRARCAGDAGSTDGTARDADDAGNAIVEFLGVALLLLVPVVYLALTLGRLQATTFAVDGAAREAARAIATAEDADAADRRALTAVGLALADQGVEADPAAATTVTCDGECLAPGTTITVHVVADVPLPGTGWLQGVVPLSVPVTATATAVRDSWVADGTGR